MNLPSVVYNTDLDWFLHFRPEDRQVQIDEVNFWQPTSKQNFGALKRGQPFFFRLKRPQYAIAGFGLFARFDRLPVGLAWEVFGQRNGFADEASFRRALAQYRSRMTEPLHQDLNCIVLQEVVFLPSRDWVPWRDSEGWSRNIVSFKKFDLAVGSGQLLAEILAASNHQALPEFGHEFEPLAVDDRNYKFVPRAERPGQRAFKLQLLAAYDRQCAVTTEHALPVLDAAHIQPYRGRDSDHPQNGIILRSDLHRLYDRGYLTITPDLELEVSQRLSDEFNNGKRYYELQGKQIIVPGDPRLAPSRSALDWHASHVFR
ncbi:MAG: HNH endonuclease [Chloroflexi bacterium]|nr:HNH endonuclease [Chloroflexota bacterium]